MEVPGVVDASTTLMPVMPLVADAGIAMLPETFTGEATAFGVAYTLSAGSKVPFLSRSINTATPYVRFEEPQLPLCNENELTEFFGSLIGGNVV